jgi:hypothetical protein
MGTAFGWDLGAAQAAGRLVISYVAMGDLDLDDSGGARCDPRNRTIRLVPSLPPEPVAGGLRDGGQGAPSAPAGRGTGGALPRRGNRVPGPNWGMISCAWTD